MRRGKARNTSVSRISAASAQPPRYPALQPTTSPTGAAITVTSATMPSVMRAPESSRDRMSPPELVGAEPMLRARRLEPLGQVLRRRREGREPRRQRRRQQHQPEDHEPGQRQAVAQHGAREAPGLAEPRLEARARRATGLGEIGPERHRVLASSRR